MLRALTIGAVVIAVAACGDTETGRRTANAAVPAPAIAVSGDPARLSGANDATADSAEQIDKVVMIGDSITNGATAALDDRFGLLGLDDVITAENGKRMAVASKDNPSGASVAKFLANAGDGDHRDEIWVVALGTNDVSQYAGPDEMAAAVNEVLDQVPADVPLVWVDTYIRGRDQDAATMNGIIRDRVGRRGNSVVASWAEFAAGDGVLSGDGVHPTTDGADVFAFVVTDTVRAFLGR